MLRDLRIWIQARFVTVTEPELPSESLTVNILVDANRDGVVSASDEAFEDQWNAQAGAIFPPNLDDDDNDGTRDGIDADWTVKTTS